ncbi:MAG: hypothetical protein AAFR84_18750 [Pseudomonadota bacterium]
MLGMAGIFSLIMTFIIVVLYAVTGRFFMSTQNGDPRRSAPRVLHYFALICAALSLSFTVVATWYDLRDSVGFGSYIDTVRLIFPASALMIVVFSIGAAIVFNPSKLKVASGAAIGFLCAAYAYDGYQAAKATIEEMARLEREGLE